MRWTRRAAVALATLALGTTGVEGASGADAATSLHWASVAKATVHPGVQVTIAGVHCVAGFVMTDGRRVFLTVPGSCAGVDDGKPTDGCTAAQVPYGLKVRIQGARYRGRMAYSSYTEMQLRGTKRPNVCANNALVLIRVDSRDIKRTNPSLPVVGGPTGVATTSPGEGDNLTAYLNGAPTQALAMQNSGAGWAHSVQPSSTVAVSQLGSPVLNGAGRAIGMVTLLAQIPGGPVTVSDLAKEIDFMHHLARLQTVHLARGTRKFTAA